MKTKFLQAPILTGQPVEVAVNTDERLVAYVAEIQQILTTDGDLTECYFNFERRRGFLAFIHLFQQCIPLAKPAGFWLEFLESLVPTLPAQRLSFFLIEVIQKKQDCQAIRLALKLARFLPDQELTIIWQAFLQQPPTCQLDLFEQEWQQLFEAWNPPPELHFPLIQELLKRPAWAFLRDFLGGQLGKLGNFSAQEILKDFF